MSENLALNASAGQNRTRAQNEIRTNLKRKQRTLHFRSAAIKALKRNIGSIRKKSEE
ncbi:hypothetical protein TOL_0042 [Thalassolituus oleivorans MIL-1]|uniref:Uncharacterized protein n=1 Tax=Thalassolituus oleivorans MIL-1 TaxID=1298593 RepID=M5DME5_9GAMM|nr:hypothetical protein TOL_0042 [Thalassolituus oleivorans MIL-1]